MVARNGLADLKKSFLSSTFEVVNEKTARIPIVFSVVKNFELDKSGLPSLDCGVVLILWAVILFRYMLNMCQVFDCRASLRTEHAWYPRGPILLLSDSRKFDVVFKTYLVLFPLLFHFVPLFLTTAHLPLGICPVFKKRHAELWICQAWSGEVFTTFYEFSDRHALWTILKPLL